MLLGVPFVDLKRVHVLYQDDNGECVGSYMRMARWAHGRGLKLTEQSFGTAEGLRRGVLDVERRDDLASTLLHVEVHGSPQHDGEGINIEGANRPLIDVLSPRPLQLWALLAGGCWLGSDEGVKALRQTMAAEGVPVIASSGVTYAGTLRAYVLPAIARYIDARGELALSDLIHPDQSANDRQEGWRVR